MNEPVVTAATPPRKVKSLAQQEVDFTAEGAPPPGAVDARASSTSKAGQAATATADAAPALTRAHALHGVGHPKRHHHGK